MKLTIQIVTFLLTIGALAAIGARITGSMLIPLATAGVLVGTLICFIVCLNLNERGTSPDDPYYDADRLN